jgi:hypothetical protein
MEKKIKVEIELSPEQVRELIESGVKGPKCITNEELEKLAEGGLVRAADYLDEAQMTIGAELFGGWISKLKKKISNKAVVSVAVEVAIKAADKLSAAQTIEGPDRPKE